MTGKGVILTCAAKQGNGSSAGSAGSLVPHAASREHLVGVAPRPVPRGQYLDLVKPSIPGLLHPGAYERQIDDPVPPHPAVGEGAPGGEEPIAELKSEQALLPGSLGLRLQLRVPPDVIGIARTAPGPPPPIQLRARVGRLPQP